MHVKKILSVIPFVALIFGAHGAWADVALQREPVDLRLGQRVRVDDGTCPAGKIKEVVAAKQTERGVARTRTCVKK